MATQTAKKSAPKAQAKKAAPAAKKTTRPPRPAERDVRTLVSDGAYAIVGVGDGAVELLKRLPDEIQRLRTETPKTVESRVKAFWEETPEEVKARLEKARKEAEKEFDAYTKRGRSVVKSVQNAKATKRALEQTKAARSQVKAATTSVRKALGQTVEAVESAADKVGDEQRAS